MPLLSINSSDLNYLLLEKLKEINAFLAFHHYELYRIIPRSLCTCKKVLEVIEKALCTNTP
jgi:hypothetical protein